MHPWPGCRLFDRMVALGAVIWMIQLGTADPGASAGLPAMMHFLAQTPSARPDLALTRGGLLDRLPDSSEIGANWKRELSLLIDPLSTPTEFFVPGTAPEITERLRNQVKPGAHCQMHYLVDGSLRIDAWLTRHPSEEGADVLWKNLEATLALPASPDGRETRRNVKVNGSETFIFEAPTGCTMWAKSGKHTLALNLPGANHVPESFFKTAGIFLKRLAGSTALESKPSVKAEKLVLPHEDEPRVVHVIGDLHVAVRRADPEKVRLETLKPAQFDSRHRFRISNLDQAHIVVWNVRVQVQTPPTLGSKEPGWETIRSDYPCCAAGIEPGAMAEEFVEPPKHFPWRVCMIYTRQSGSPGAKGASNVKVLGEYELVSPPVLSDVR